MLLHAGNEWLTQTCSPDTLCPVRHTQTRLSHMVAASDLQAYRVTAVCCLLASASSRALYICVCVCAATLCRPYQLLLLLHCLQLLWLAGNTNTANERRDTRDGGDAMFLDTSYMSLHTQHFWELTQHW